MAAIHHVFYRNEGGGGYDTLSVSSESTKRKLHDILYYAVRQRFAGWDVPRGVDGRTYKDQPDEAPCGFSFFQLDPREVMQDYPPNEPRDLSGVYCSGFNGLDGFSRPTLCGHLVYGLSGLSPRHAIRLYGQPGWIRQIDQSRAKSGTLPEISDIQDLDAMLKIPPASNEIPRALTRAAGTTLEEFLAGKTSADRMHKVPDTVTRISNVRENLIFTIQAFLTDKDKQIFIADHPDRAAATIQGVLESLPEGLIHDVTFSTYQREAIKAAEGAGYRIAATEWKTKSTDPGFSESPVIPESYYNPSGEAFAINTLEGSTQLHGQPSRKTELPVSDRSESIKRFAILAANFFEGDTPPQDHMLPILRDMAERNWQTLQKIAKDMDAEARRAAAAATAAAAASNRGLVGKVWDATGKKVWDTVKNPVVYVAKAVWGANQVPTDDVKEPSAVPAFLALADFFTGGVTQSAQINPQEDINRRVFWELPQSDQDVIIKIINHQAGQTQIPPMVVPPPVQGQPSFYSHSSTSAPTVAPPGVSQEELIFRKHGVRVRRFADGHWNLIRIQDGTLLVIDKNTFEQRYLSGPVGTNEMSPELGCIETLVASEMLVNSGRFFICRKGLTLESVIEELQKAEGYISGDNGGNIESYAGKWQSQKKAGGGGSLGFPSNAQPHHTTLHPLQDGNPALGYTPGFRNSEPRQR